MSHSRPLVGTAVFVFDTEWRFLLGKRKSNFWDGTWCIPGWHLEFWESFEDCVKREALEEAGVRIRNVQFLGINNDVIGERHYVTIFMRADYEDWEIIPQLDEFEEVIWTDYHSLPQNLFPIFKNFLDKNPKVLGELL